MLQEAAKNLWILLTLIIPGSFTYGIWRLALLLGPGRRLDYDALVKMDDSAIVLSSVIIAVALLQQSVAIAIESALALLAKTMRQRWPCLHLLFCERFALSTAGRLDENATRIIGNFFLSINISVGVSLLLLYFLAYEGMDAGHWIPRGLMIFLAVILITAVFRAVNAIWAIEACKDKP